MKLLGLPCGPDIAVLCEEILEFRNFNAGVATFCRVESAFSSNEVALPLAAEEGFTGVLESSKGFRRREDEGPTKAAGLEEFSKEELLKIDSEGRCVITDHGHFGEFDMLWINEQVCCLP